jgi:dGTPase
MNIRQQTEEIEARILHPLAAQSSKSLGRDKRENEGDLRTCYQRDRDRIIHCKSFRRLKHKTQVFLAPRGDHYRTRLTHVLEVSQVARTIARALRLNEDLVEAIALGHDLGHTPFGHAGEAVLRKIHPGGFHHYEQSLRVVEFIENKGKGLNLTKEVRDGIVKHSKGKGLIVPKTSARSPLTLEGQVVRFSDIIAYLNHDLDDALRAKVLKRSDLSDNILKTLGDSHSKRIDTMVRDFIYTSLETDLEKIGMSEPVMDAIEELRAFLYAHVYEGEKTKKEFTKSKKILEDLYRHYLEHPEEVFKILPQGDAEDLHRGVCDFIAGMTDRFALASYERLFLPEPWKGY